MAAEVIAVSSASAGAGKTHVAAAVARLLKQRGWVVAPLAVTGRRSARLMAEACGLTPKREHWGGWAELEKAKEDAEVVVVECGLGEARARGIEEIEIRREGGELAAGGLGRLALFEPALVEEADEELMKLPEWKLGEGPRLGVVSLPHMTNFGDYVLARGAEWLATVRPGRFDIVFMPESGDWASDREWLEMSGLREWLEGQQRDGARVVWSGAGLGWGGERVEVGELSDWRAMSRVVGRRLEAPAAEEEELDRLAEWVRGLEGLEGWLAGRL